MGKELKEQLLRVNNSHELVIGQVVRIVDKDLLEGIVSITGKENNSHILGVIEEIDGEDIRVSVHLGDPDQSGYDFSGWNLDFSVIW
jgi:hypothetical protein